MKNTLLFMKNNRIIYKISILLMVVMMLICVVWITPNKENKKTSSDTVYNYYIALDLSADREEDYGLYNGETGEDLELTGISYKKINGVHTVTLQDFKFTTSCNIAFEVWNSEGVSNDIKFVVNGENEISSMYTPNKNEYAGIINWSGGIIFEGSGSLEVNSYNWNTSSYESSMAICAYDSNNAQGNVTINMDETGLIIAQGNGRNGIGINAEKAIVINSGNVVAHGGDNGVCSGINGDEYIDINGGNIDLKASTIDEWAGGIDTDSNGVDTLSIQNAVVNIEVSCNKETMNDLKQAVNVIEWVVEERSIETQDILDYIEKVEKEHNITKVDDFITYINADNTVNADIYEAIRDVLEEAQGAGIDSGYIEINNSEINVNISGTNIIGIWSELNEDNYSTYSGTGTIIKDNSKISIVGDVTSNKMKDSWSDIVGLYATNNNILIDDAVVDIDMKNTKDDEHSRAMQIYVDENIDSIGQLIVNSGSNVHISNKSGYGIEVYSEYAGDDYNDHIEDRVSINGGNLVVQSSEATFENNVDFTFVENGEPNTDVISVATDYEGKNKAEFDKSTDEYSDEQYHYMHFGEIYDFYLTFDSATGLMYKNDDDTRIVTSGDVPGWTLDGSKGSYRLVLDGFNFTTSNRIGLNIIGNATIELKEDSQNSIRTCYEDGDGLTHGSMVINSSGELTILGNGLLDIQYNTEYNNMTTAQSSSVSYGIYCEDVLHIKNGAIVDIEGNSYGAYGIYSRYDSEVDNSDINIYIQGEKGKTVGIDCLDGNMFSVHNKSKVYIDINLDENVQECYGIKVYSLEVEDSLVDINMDIGSSNNDELKQCIIYVEGFEMYDWGEGFTFYLDITGSNVVLNADMDRGIGIYSAYAFVNVTSFSNIKCSMTKENNTCKGMVVDFVDENVVVDSTVEITADKAIGEYTSISLDDEIDIREAKANGVNVIAPTMQDVSSYDYIKIQPIYYLIYQNGMIYKSHDTMNPVTISGCSVSNGKIIMDGFYFTTSSMYGLYSEQELSIELAEGSTNSIDVKYQLGYGEASSNIYSKENISISGKGKLSVDNTSEPISGVDYCDIQPIYSEKNISLDTTSLEICAKGMSIYGMMSFGTVNIQNSNVNFEYDSGSQSSFGIVGYSDVIINESIINVNSDAYSIMGITSQCGNIDIIGGQASVNGKSGYGVFLMSGTDKVTNILDTNIDINLASGTGIYNRSNVTTDISNTIVIDNSDVNIDVESTVGSSDIYGISAEYGSIAIDDSSINAEIKTPVGAYGIRAYNKMSITDSLVKMNMSTVYSMGIYSVMLDVYINNSRTDINISGEDTTSVYIGIGSAKERVDIGHSFVNMDLKGGYSSGIYAGDFFNDMPAYYNNEVTDINIAKSNIAMNIVSNSSSQTSYGIRAYRNVNLTDMGFVDLSITSAYSTYGVWAKGKITLDGVVGDSFTGEDISGVINVKGVDEVAGIYSKEGAVEFKATSRATDLDINVLNGATEYGVYANTSFTSNNANVDIICSSQLDDSKGYGINVVANDINITEGKIYIKFNTSDWNSITGILAYSGDHSDGKNIIYLNDVDIDIDGTCNDGYAYGIESGCGMVNINGGTVDCVIKSKYIEIISAHYGITVINAKINGICTSSVDEGRIYGLYVAHTNDINIRNSTVNIEVIESPCTRFFGFIGGAVGSGNGSYSECTNIVVNNSDVVIHVNSNSSSDNTYFESISAYGKFTMTGGKLDIDLKAKKGEVYGIWTIQTVTLDSIKGDGSTENNKLVNISVGANSIAEAIYVADESIIVNNTDLNIEVLEGATQYGINSAKNLNITSSNVDIKTDIAEDGITVGTTANNFPIYINGGESLFKDSTLNFIASEKGIGMYIGGGATLEIEGGTTIVKGAYIKSGSGQYTLDDGGDMATVLLEGSRVYNMNTLLLYPTNSSLSTISYKYIKIGTIPTYYFRYNASSGVMYKVPKDGEPVELANAGDIVSGWSILDGKLYLNGFEFITTAKKVIDVVGNGEVVINGNNNTIRTVYNEKDATYYGIYANEGNLTLSGAGKISIYGDNENYAYSSNIYYGVYSNSDIIINNLSTLYIKAKEIQCYGVKGKSITVNKSSLDLATIQGEKAVGLYTEEGDISIINSSAYISMYGRGEASEDKYVSAIYTDKNLNISDCKGTNKKLEVKIGSLSYRGDTIYAGESIDIENCDNIIVQTKSTVDTVQSNYYSSAIRSDGELTISGCTVNAQHLILANDGTGGYGIYAKNKLSISNSATTFKGAMGAMWTNLETVSVYGSIKASQEYAGTPIELQDGMNLSNIINNGYAYIMIEPVLLSVDITWGDMDFTYKPFNWDPVSRSYKTHTWTPKDTVYGDKITITNSISSTSSVKANVKFNTDEAYSSITGSILSDKTNKTPFVANTSVAVGTSIDAYLSLDGSLAAGILNQVIGNITITLAQ